MSLSTSSAPVANRQIIALTGATGFIGGTLARRFVASGWQVRALVRNASRAQPLRKLGVELVGGDLTDHSALQALVRAAHSVVHCAGMVRGVSEGDFFPVNANGVESLARAAAAQEDAPLFLYLSSLAAREPQLSPYAASKRAGEQALASVAGPMRWIALRPPAVYGPGDREMRPLLLSMMRGLAPILGTENARFSLLFVDDLASAIESCIVAPNCPNGIYELHDGRTGGYRWQDVIQIAAELRGKPVFPVRIPQAMLHGLSVLSIAWGRLLGRSPMLTPAKVRELTHPDWACDNLAFSQACGWEPAIGFAEGLRRTVAMTGTTE